MGRRVKITIGLISIALVLGGVTYIRLQPRATTLPAQTEEVPLPVKLEIFTDKVTVQSPGSETFVDAVNNQEIPVGTKIKTSEMGRAQLLYPNGSVTRIDFKSEITLASFDATPFQAKVNLSVGRIWSRIAKLLGNESYETESPTLVASIRGTSYGHGILANGDNRVTVTKGLVKGNCLNNIQIAQIDKTKMGTFNCKASLPQIQDTAKTTFIKNEWFIFNNQEDQKLNERFGEETYDDEVEVTPTPKPTIKPTATPRPTTLGTSAPTPTPTPGPVAPAPTITSVNSQNCTSKLCPLIIKGTEFYDVTTIRIFDSKNNQQPLGQTSQFSLDTANGIIDVSFSNLPSGILAYIQVVTSSHGDANSSAFSVR